MKRTTCEECGTRVTLDIQDGPEPTDLIGAECPCGYYVTRYNDQAAARKAGLA